MKKKKCWEKRNESKIANSGHHKNILLHKFIKPVKQAVDDRKNHQRPDPLTGTTQPLV